MLDTRSPDSSRPIVPRVLAWTAVLLIVLTAAASHAIDRMILAALVLANALILLDLHRSRLRTMAIDRRLTGRRLATIDPATGFHTARTFVERGSDLLIRGAGSDRILAVMVVEFDPAAGPDVGASATVLRDCTPRRAILGRLDGDRLAAAFLVDRIGSSPIESVVERIVSTLGRAVSIGTSIADRSGAPFETLLRRAEIAASEAGDRGGSGWLAFDPTMERRRDRRATLENDLRAALARHGIVPAFDPQVDLTNGDLVGFEILARWPHPTLGLLDAADFLPIAEEAGLVDALTMLVLEQACAAARDWAEHLAVSINLSPSQLRDPWLAQRIVKVMTATGFPARRLEVEITEACLPDNLPLVQSTLASLKAQGVGVVLDDFGTGASSLTYLRALPLDRIKIDRAVVAAMTTDPGSAAVVHAIVGMGDSLNLPVIAEGVGDIALADRVAAIGCRYAQGRAYGQPLDVSGARRLIVERRPLMPARGVA